MMQSIEVLSTLALTQLRLDVEAAAKEAGRKTSGLVDDEFFDPLELDEDNLEGEMSKLGLADQFHEMRMRAQIRFPKEGAPEGARVQWFVDRYKSQNWLGIKGVYANAATFLDAQQLGEAEFEQFATAVNLTQGSEARAMMDTIARRFAKARSAGVCEYRYWAEHAVASLLDEEQFELMVDVASDMGGMFADELVAALHAEPLDARMNRKRQSGGAPSVFYRAVPVA